MLYFWIRIVSMVRALPLRWCNSTLPRFSESILFETCVPLTFDGIYNSKFTQYLLIHYCPHLTYLGFSPHHFCLLSCAEYRAEEPYFFCNDRYLKMVCYSILYSNVLWYFLQVHNNNKAKTRLMIYNTQISQLHFLHLIATQFHNILL